MRPYGGQRRVQQQFLGEGVGECTESGFGWRVGTVADDWQEGGDGRSEDDVFCLLVGVRGGSKVVDP